MKYITIKDKKFAIQSYSKGERANLVEVDNNNWNTSITNLTFKFNHIPPSIDVWGNDNEFVNKFKKDIDIKEIDNKINAIINKKPENTTKQRALALLKLGKGKMLMIS